MSEESKEEGQQIPRDGMSWQQSPEWPVYGLTKGAPAPDFETPWSFQRHSQPPQQNPTFHPAPAQPQSGTQHEVQATPQHPVQQQQQYPQQAPPEPFHGPTPPSPLGPALTPEERYRQLFPDDQ